MISIKFIPSKDNLPTNVYKAYNSLKYKYTEDSVTKENRVYYEAFLVDSEAIIYFEDLCIITSPYEAEEYVERCYKITNDYDREVFYGKEGTRCLLCDVAKIIGVSRNYEEESNFTKLDSATIISFINKKPIEWY